MEIAATEPVFPDASVVVPPIVTIPFGKVEIFTVVVQVPPAPTDTVRLMIPLVPVILKLTRALTSPLPEITSAVTCVPLTVAPLLGVEMLVAGNTCASFFKVIVCDCTALLAESVAEIGRAHV